jgi:uncharacterized protein
MSRLTATDLAAFAECPHTATLARDVRLGALGRPPRRDGFDELLVLRGQRHEDACLTDLASKARVASIPPGPGALDATLAAMRAGADVLYQAELASGRLFGRPDFLVRAPLPSALGDWSYEVLDAKLAGRAKPRALLQVAFYSLLLAELQGVLPRAAHLVLGDGRRESFPTGRLAAYVRRVLARFDAANAAPVATYPEPVDHCDVCDWLPRCDARRRADDHLTFVAGITRRQRRALVDADAPTMRALASLRVGRPSPVPSIGLGALTRLREQARLQVEGRERQAMLYELLPRSDDRRGLELLPAPSPGDVFLDLEGDAYVLPGGLEYLFGLAEAAPESAYTAHWALDRAGERDAFERTIGRIVERRARHPDMHVYHYGHYEPTALKRLAGRHARCVDELDALLRGRVFVDLYAVVRHALRASVESYSIKRLEPLYGFTRSVALRDANACLAAFELWFEVRASEALDEALRREIEGYNRDDCLSTVRLRDWLEERRRELESTLGAPLERPPLVASEPSEALAEELGRARVVRDALLAGVPEEPRDRRDDEHARWLLAHLLEWHRREDKSSHWEYYRLCALSDEELEDERAPLGGLSYVGVVGSEKSSRIHRYRYPPQDHALDRALEIHDPRTQARAGTLVAIDDAACTIDVKRGVGWSGPHPTALVPRDIVTTSELRESLLRYGAEVAQPGGASRAYVAASALLHRSPPPGALAFHAPRDVTERAVASVLAMDGAVLPIQGPPGTGKTVLAARMIAALLHAGRRVGITAHSHRVITNLLDEACRVAEARDVRLAGVQKGKPGECSLHPFVGAGDVDDVVRALASGEANLAAGTAWLWARSALIGSVDVLFVDEAGQMALANALAAAPAAPNLVLLGDPQQLDQPSKGLHPPGMPASALAHVLGGEATLPAGRGLFLEETWRMHADVCGFVSEQFYDGRLRPRPELARLRLDAPPPLDGTGLRFVPVPHHGNRSESIEEVEAVRRLVDLLLRSGAQWTDASGERRPLAPEDVLVVAPYNAHVARLAEALGPVRVGTVDKFQGQQAPVVVYSMATSSPEDAPHGAEFLYSANRFNVAVSRARCAAFLVASPHLLDLPCKTARHVELVNAFCRYVELAREVRLPAGGA